MTHYLSVNREGKNNPAPGIDKMELIVAAQTTTYKILEKIMGDA